MIEFVAVGQGSVVVVDVGVSVVDVLVVVGARLVHLAVKGDVPFCG